MNKIYGILAHPKGRNSLSGHLFYETVKHLRQQGAIVDVLDLYEQSTEIPFYIPMARRGIVSDTPVLDDNEFFKKNKERFMAADSLFLVYPIYWYAVPGIMKCWLDLLTSFAWKYEGQTKAKPLHKIKKSFIVNLSSAPAWYLKYIKGNTATRTVTNTFKWMGIKQCKSYSIGKSHQITAEKIAQHLEKIKHKSLFLAHTK